MAAQAGAGKDNRRFFEAAPALPNSKGIRQMNRSPRIFLVSFDSEEVRFERVADGISIDAADGIRRCSNLLIRCLYD